MKNLSVYYNDFCVLKNLNFKAEQGEFIAIVGQSASGKTTLLKALAHFIPHKGKIKTPRRIGMIFQNYAVFPWLTVSENIAFGLENIKSQEKEKIINKHLNLTGLKEKKNNYPWELSGGQIQRTALARSLAPNPDVLLMDEPYGSLDAYTRDKMQKWLLDIWSKHKKTIIFVTHNIEEAIFLADRVMILKDKALIKELKISFSRPRKKHIKFTTKFNKIRKEILNILNYDN